MPKPTTIPTWATDAGARVDPGPARNATGFIPGKKLPAKWLNWVLAQGGDWFQYLRDLHLEPEFLNKDYSWTGVQKLAQGFIANSWGVQGETRYVSATGVLTPKARTIRVPISAFQAGAGGSLAGWVFMSNVIPRWVSSADSTDDTPLVLEYRPPAGTVLKGLRAGVSPEAGGVVNATLGVSYVTEASPPESAIVIASQSTSGGQVAGVLSLTLSVPKTLASEEAVYVAFKTTGSFRTVYWVKLLVDDVGPQNF